MRASVADSIYNLRPLETGGTQNRIGIDFQDHVAADFCLDMLLDAELEEVWCETQDDITLIWSRSGQRKVEFVQVKSNEFDHLWSIAILCNRDGKGIGHSILEKCLANDRCIESCCFRMVTARPVNQDLEILTYSLDSAHRLTATEALNTLAVALGQKVKEFKSENQNDYSSWMANATWDVRHTKEAIENKARRKIRKILESEGTFLAEDQIGEVYSRLLNKVWAAGLAKYEIDPAAKRITKADLTVWFRKIVDESLHPTVVGGGKKMQEKMESASIPTDTIQTALEERRYYREEVLKPQYLSLSDRGLMEREVLARLQRLKSQLDAGTVADSGKSFHELCLLNLEELQKTLPLKSEPSLVFLHGCMYTVVDRCLHRFRRAA